MVLLVCDSIRWVATSNWSDWNWPIFNYDMKILAILWNGRCPWQNYLQGGECGSSCTHVKCQKFEGTILQPVCKLVSFSYLLQVLQPKCTKEMLVTVTVTADRILFCEEKNSRFIHNLQFDEKCSYLFHCASFLTVQVIAVSSACACALKSPTPTSYILHNSSQIKNLTLWLPCHVACYFTT